MFSLLPIVPSRMDVSLPWALSPMLFDDRQLGWFATPLACNRPWLERVGQGNGMGRVGDCLVDLLKQ